VTAFEIMQKHYRQRDLAAREWKEKGGKVVGYICDSVPEEIILAAGFFPLRLSGDPNSGTDVADKFVIPEYEGFVRSMLNMLLTGRYDFLDFLIIPHARDAVHQIYAILSDVKSSDPTLKLPVLYFFDNLHTTFHLSQVYNREQVIAFKQKLEEWSGSKISNASLSKAIIIGNENKMLLKKMAALRATDPPCISGVEALQIIGSSMFMLKEDHNKLLQEFLNEDHQLSGSKGVRLFVEGSPLDNLQLYEIVESCNATIIAEDNCWGNRYSDVPIDTSLDPFEAIVDRYHRKSPCPRIHPLSRRVEYCVKSAVEVKTQGVIFNNLDNDSQAWDIPDEVEALEEKGISTLYLKKQPYLISDLEKVKVRIKGFICCVKPSKY